MYAIREEERHRVSKVNIYRCGISYVSQPLNYFLILLVFHGSMTIYFKVTVQLNSPPIVIATAVLYALTTIIHLAFPFIDPGVIPSILPEYEEPLHDVIPLNKELLRARQREYNFSIKSHFVRARFCPQCLIFRPPRAAHCWVCNVCVEKIDHHCPWIGVCVGKRNYRLFFAFLTSLQAMMTLVILQGFNWALHMSQPDDPIEYIFNVLLSTLIIIIVFLAVVASMFVITLLILHLKLIGQNKTTNQFCLGRWEAISGNPYEKFNCIKNIIKACCKVKEPLNNPSSKVHLRSSHIENTQEYFSKYMKTAERENPMLKYRDGQSFTEKFAEIHIKTIDEVGAQKNNDH